MNDAGAEKCQMFAYTSPHGYAGLIDGVPAVSDAFWLRWPALPAALEDSPRPERSVTIAVATS